MENQKEQTIRELLENYRPGEDLSRVTTPEQRFELMWQLVIAEHARRGVHIDALQFRRDIGGVIQGKSKYQ